MNALDLVNCEYCDTEYPQDGTGDDPLVCVASQDHYCDLCRSDHVESCAACSADLYAG